MVNQAEGWYVNHWHDGIILRRGDTWPIKLVLPQKCLLKILVQSQKVNSHVCLCAIGIIYFATVSKILRLDFGNGVIFLYLFFILLSYCAVTLDNIIRPI